MEAVKKLCTFFRSVASPMDLFGWKKRIQDLPLEMLVNIFKYLPPKQTVMLQNECRSFRIAVALNVKGMLTNIRLEIRKQVTRLQTKLLNIVRTHKMLHPGLVRTLLTWRCLQMDVSLLYILVWRYRNDMHVWCALSNFLGPIFEEVQSEMKALGEEEWKGEKSKVVHEHLENFLRRFTEEIEVHFYSSEKWTPFEIRLIELMFCCPCGNLKMQVRTDKTGNKRIAIYHELRDTKDNVSLPNVKEQESRANNEREILKFMREYIRKANLFLIHSIVKKIENFGVEVDDFIYDPLMHELVVFTTYGDESSIKYSKTMLSNGTVEELYERCLTTNVGRCGLTCSFEIKNVVTIPLIFNSLNEISDKVTEYDPNKEVLCYACSQPAIDNAFALSILCDYNKNRYIKEVLVLYEGIKNNYFMASYKHII